MFGFSFGELVVLVVVAIVVIGPKDLPKVLRKLGQFAGKLRRMAAELRAQSGIDDVLRAEGLSDDINEIRKLARGELDQVARAARLDSPARPSYAQNGDATKDPYNTDDSFPIDHEREYPKDGADAYRALPDTAITYAETLPKSPHATSPLYRTGDPNGVIPEPSAPPPSETIETAAVAEGADATLADAPMTDAIVTDAIVTEHENGAAAPAEAATTEAHPEPVDPSLPQRQPREEHP